MKRDVVCMKNLAVVSDDNCVVKDKPDAELQCQRPACEPRWYMTDWPEVQYVITVFYIVCNVYKQEAKLSLG